MKRLTLIIAAIASLLSFSSCNDDNIVKPIESDGYEYTFTVLDDNTRATLNSTGVSWEAGDKVGMFLDGYTGYANINTETNPTTAILYSANAIPADSYAFAYYPYDSNNNDKTTTQIFVPNVQVGGSTSSMPLAGVPFKIESEIEALAKPNGEIHFMNLGSVIDFKVYSDTYNTETISQITFTATSKKDLEGHDTDLAVSGDGFLDLTSVKTNDESTLNLTFGLGTDYDYAKVNNLSVAVADTKENATSVYLVVAPGIYSGTITIATDAATYDFPFTSKSLARSTVKHYNMNLDNATRTAGVVETVKDLPYSEPFSTGIGEFKTDGVKANGADVWQFASGYGMKATSSFNSGADKYDATSWLISPWIDLTSVSAAYVSFDHVHRYAGTATNEYTLWVLTDETNADWVQVTIPKYGTGSNWAFVNTGEILLNAYVGNKVKLGFKYIGTTTNAGTWEIKNFYVAEKVYTTEFTKTADAITVEVGKTKNNNVTVNSGATITYSSDDESVATVAADGTVTGVAVGTTTINYEVAANGLYPAASGSFDVTVVAAISYSNFTWDLSIDETSSASVTELAWNYRGVTMVAAKASASTATNNYYPGTAGKTYTSTRFYSGSNLTITPYPGSSVGYVEFEATQASYATALKNSTWTNATASVNNTTVTVEPEDGTAAFSATISGTCGFSSVTVYYTGNLEPLANYTVTLTSPSEPGCSYTASVGGSPISSGDEVTSGQKVTLAASPSSDYVFGSWTVKDGSDNDVSVTNNEFTMPSSNVTVSATFIRQYTITCNPTTNGSISASAAKAIAGTEITLTATPNAGYQLDSWTVTDESSNSVTVTNNKFTMPASNVTVDASFLAGKTTVYTFATAQSSSNTAYATNYSVTINSIQWSVPGNQNFSGYVRIGGKSLSGVDRVIYGNGESSITGDVDEIVIATNGVSNTNFAVNSITVTAHPTKADAANGMNGVSFTTTDNLSFSVGTSKSLTYTKSGTTNCSGYYYRIVFNVSNSNKSSNYGLDVNSITFYKN